VLSFEGGIKMNTITATRDDGLRGYMLKVYNWMSAGLAITGLVAWGMFTTGLAALMATSTLATIVIGLSPLLIIVAMWFVPNDPVVHGALFLTLATLMGMSMSTIFLTYSLGTIFQAFFATAVGFLGASLFGYVTKKDMSVMGTFFTVGLFGLIGLMILNIFIVSTVFTLVVSGLGVLLFAGLTAYDTQKIKDTYTQGYGSDVAAIQGALGLYLDFINMFLHILRILGIFGSDD
jgi:FtsH-binding integral membrane protein